VASLGNLQLLIFTNSKLLSIIWRRDEQTCNLQVSMNARANKQAKHQEPTHQPPPGEEQYVESDDLECFILDFNLALSSSVTGSWVSALSWEQE
jgi:hypothetical protein